ncbi:hypothetical protein [Streptomyces sp. NPDC096153]
MADRAGFGSANSLRQHMRELVGVSPAVYRRTFHTEATGGRAGALTTAKA